MEQRAVVVEVGDEYQLSKLNQMLRRGWRVGSTVAAMTPNAEDARQAAWLVLLQRTRSFHPTAQVTISRLD